MKSLKNFKIFNNDVYKIIRKFYSFHFPYPVEFTAIDAINLALEEVGGNLGAKGKLALDPNENIVFILDKGALPSNSKFKNTSDCQDIVDDVVRLHEWLVKYEYIDKKVATPKLISTPDLIF